MNGAIVDTPKGRGTVVGYLKNGRVVVKIEKEPEREDGLIVVYSFAPDEVKEVEA